MEANFEKLKKEVQKRLESAPGCHDWDHTLRVFRNALLIADEEIQPVSRQSLEIIKAGALLHDIGRASDLNGEKNICHALLGAEMAPEILIDCGYEDESFIKHVAECVKRHRFRGKTDAPETIEQKIIYDADKLDSIGAVGIARAIHFSGRIGSRLHNTEKEAAVSEAYSYEDSAYREYLVKLRYIPDRMLTETGARLASERAEFMHLFFEVLNKEVFG
jgi:uncharacterized protein